MIYSKTQKSDTSFLLTYNAFLKASMRFPLRWVAQFSQYLRECRVVISWHSANTFLYLALLISRIVAQLAFPRLYMVEAISHITITGGASNDSVQRASSVNNAAHAGDIADHMSFTSSTTSAIHEALQNIIIG